MVMMETQEKTVDTPSLVPSDFRVVNEIYPVPPVSGWTGPDIVAAINSNDQGDFSVVELLYHAMTKVPRIGAALEQRVHEIRNFKFKLNVPADAPERMKNMSLVFEQNFSDVFPNHAQTEILRRIIMFGFCIARQHFIIRHGQVLPVIVPWTNSSVYWQIKDRNFYVTTEKGDRVPVVGDPWMIFTVGGDRPWLNGAIRKLAFPFYQIDHAYARWLAFNDTEAQSLKKITTPRFMREQAEAGAAAQAVAHLRSGDTMLCPYDPKEGGYDIEFVTASGRSSAYKAFQDLIDSAHTEISITLLGNNLTQEIKGGSFAAAKSATDEKMRIAQSDVEFLGRPIYTSTTRLWVEKNFTPSFYHLPSLIQYRPKPNWDVDSSGEEESKSISAQKYSQSISSFMTSAGNAGVLSQLPIDWTETARRCGVILKSNQLPEVASHD